MKLFSALLSLVPTALLSITVVPAKAGGYHPTQHLFHENLGQVHDQYLHRRNDILFYATDGAFAWHLRSAGMSYQQYRVEEWKTEEDPTTGTFHQVPSLQTVHRLDVEWLGAQPDAQALGQMAVPGVTNFYLESCPEGVTGVHSYAQLRQVGIYPGVDVVWKWEQGQMKCDYHVAAGYGHDQIRLHVKGHTGLQVDAQGNLVMQTPLGALTEAAPLAMQGGHVLPARWVVEGDVVSFEVEAVDHSQPLVIDPAVRAWGTYYGGTANDDFRAVETDGSGNVIAGGQTYSNAPAVFASAGAHQMTWGGGTSDAFMAKFDPAGTRLWATLYGGANQEQILDCDADASGNCYFAGWTTSTTGTAIASPGAHQTTTTGSGNEAFLVKLSASGTRLWGTYYGNSDDVGYGCVATASGNVYLVGNTNGAFDIATPGAHQTAVAGDKDCFIAKFDSAGVRQWGTYLGARKLDRPYACAAYGSDGIVVGGVTDTLAVPAGFATAGAHQVIHGGGTKDAFIVLLDGAGIRQWGTYYGGEQDDEIRGLAVDASGNIFAAGHTYSYTNIATPGSHQSTYNATRDGFLVKLSSTCVRQWGTYVGGGLGDWVSDADVDAAGNPAIMGHTTSTTGIATSGAHKETWSGEDDTFVMHFDADGSLLWGTYYGDIKGDWAEGCSFDPSGDLVITGFSYSTSGISTASGFQPAFGGGFSDGYLAKFDITLTGMEVPNESAFLLYPNPSTGTSTIVFPAHHDGPALVQVLSPLGNVVMQMDAEGTQLLLDGAQLSCGTYLVRIQQGTLVQMVKWVVTR